MHIESSRLKYLVPLNQLHPEHRLQMMEQSGLIELNVGDELSANKEHRRFLYLIEGKLDLLGFGKSPVLLISSDERARHPIFNEVEHNVRVVAQASCKIIRFERQQFHTLQDYELILGEELETLEMNEIESNVFNEIMHAFNMGKLKLPSLPEIAKKVKTAMSNKDVDVDDIARIVSADPAIVTRLINAANGPLNRGSESIESIQSAIVRLGLNVTKDLVISFALRQLFTTKSSLLKRRMQQLYEQSIDVAAIGFALSKQSGKLSPDHVLLAGLLHEIGIIPILSYIEDAGLIISDVDELESIIESLKVAVSSMVIRHWGLSNDLMIVVEDYENWQRDSGSKVDTCDMVMVGEIYSRLKRHQLEGLPKIDEVPAFKKIFPDNVSAELIAEILKQAEAEILSVKSLFKA